VRRALVWLLALPLIAVGSQVAHGLAYWWAYPVSDVRLAILHHDGHGYLAYAPTALGFLGAIEALVLVVAIADRVRGASVRGLPPWAFLWIPLVGFTLQEHLERWLAAGSFPWWTVQEPSFWRGLVLQIPLGLLAYLIARLLLCTAEAVASAIRGRRRAPARLGPRPAGARLWDNVMPVRSAPLALGAAGRAPPRLG
jgi:hypothetical protein